jgi:hypothetical protein
MDNENQSNKATTNPFSKFRFGNHINFGNQKRIFPGGMPSDYNKKNVPMFKGSYGNRVIRSSQFIGGCKSGKCGIKPPVIVEKKEEEKKDINSDQ